VALQALLTYEGKLNRLKEDRENIGKAKEALEIAPDSSAVTAGFILSLPKTIGVFLPG